MNYEFSIFQLSQRIILDAAIGAAVSSSAAAAAVVFAIITACHVQPFELGFKVYEVDAVFGTGGGGVQVGTDGAGGAEVDAHSFDFLGQAVLFEVGADGGGREAEDTEAVDIDRAAVVEFGAHGLHKVGKHALDVAQGERAALFHLDGDAVQRGRLTPNQQLRVVLARTVSLEGVLTKLFFVSY